MLLPQMVASEVLPIIKDINSSCGRSGLARRHPSQRRGPCGIDRPLGPAAFRRAVNMVRASDGSKKDDRGLPQRYPLGLFALPCSSREKGTLVTRKRGKIARSIMSCGTTLPTSRLHLRLASSPVRRDRRTRATSSARKMTWPFRS